jgi:hypothetical protein
MACFGKYQQILYGHQKARSFSSFIQIRDKRNNHAFPRALPLRPEMSMAVI